METTRRENVQGYIYLLKFDKPISDKHTTQHYLGWAKNLTNRLRAHRTGCGARLTQVAKQRGISFEVVRVWKGTRHDERRLKNQKASPRLARFERNPSFLDELTHDEIVDMIQG